MDKLSIEEQIRLEIMNENTTADAQPDEFRSKTYRVLPSRKSIVSHYNKRYSLGPKPDKQYPALISRYNIKKAQRLIEMETYISDIMDVATKQIESNINKKKDKENLNQQEHNTRKQISLPKDKIFYGTFGNLSEYNRYEEFTAADKSTEKGKEKIGVNQKKANEWTEDCKEQLSKAKDKLQKEKGIMDPAKWNKFINKDLDQKRSNQIRGNLSNLSEETKEIAVFADSTNLNAVEVLSAIKGYEDLVKSPVLSDSAKADAQRRLLELKDNLIPFEEQQRRILDQIQRHQDERRPALANITPGKKPAPPPVELNKKKRSLSDINAPTPPAKKIKFLTPPPPGAEIIDINTESTESNSDEEVRSTTVFDLTNEMLIWPDVEQDYGTTANTTTTTADRIRADRLRAKRDEITEFLIKHGMEKKIHQSTVEIKEEIKEEEAKEEKEIKEEEAKEETKVEIKEEIKEEEAKEETKDEIKEEAKEEEIKEEIKQEIKEEIKDEIEDEDEENQVTTRAKRAVKTSNKYKDFV